MRHQLAVKLAGKTVVATSHSLLRYAQRLKGSPEPDAQVTAELSRALANGSPLYRGPHLSELFVWKNRNFRALVAEELSQFVIITVWLEGWRRLAQPSRRWRPRRRS